MMIFFGILLIMALFYMIRGHEKPNMANRQGTPAEDILKMRYVNGEIDEATFEKMKKTMRL